MGDSAFEIESIDEDGYRRIRLVGELDMANAEETRNAILEDDSAHELIVDTTGLSFIDVAGLRALIAAREHYGPRLTLIAGERTRRVLEILDLRDLFGLD